MSLTEARANLDVLLEVTTAGNPYDAVPQRWIDEFHESLIVIASPHVQSKLRLDQLLGINRQYFHHHLQDILNEFDHAPSGECDI